MTYPSSSIAVQKLPIDFIKIIACQVAPLGGGKHDAPLVRRKMYELDLLPTYTIEAAFHRSPTARQPKAT